MLLREHCVPDYANPGAEEQPLGMAQSFHREFAGEGKTLFPCQDGRALDRNASSEQHKISRLLTFLSNQLGFAHLAEHLTYHNWTVEATGNLGVTTTERHPQLPAGPKGVPKDIPNQ
jgi:hypothetical protein